MGIAALRACSRARTLVENVGQIYKFKWFIKSLYLRLSIFYNDVRVDVVVPKEGLEGDDHFLLDHYTEWFVGLVGAVPNVDVVLLQAHKGIQLFVSLQLDRVNLVTIVGFLGSQNHRGAGKEHKQETHFKRPTELSGHTTVLSPFIVSCEFLSIDWFKVDMTVYDMLSPVRLTLFNGNSSR